MVVRWLAGLEVSGAVAGAAPLLPTIVLASYFLLLAKRPLLWPQPVRDCRKVLCPRRRCPVGVATQDPKLRARLNPDDASVRVYNFLHTLAIEAQLFARACGKTNIHSLEPEDLAALTLEASACAQVPMAGTQHTVGRPDMTRF